MVVRLLGLVRRVGERQSMGVRGWALVIMAPSASPLLPLISKWLASPGS